MSSLRVDGRRHERERTHERRNGPVIVEDEEEMEGAEEEMHDDEEEKHATPEHQAAAAAAEAADTDAVSGIRTKRRRIMANEDEEKHADEEEKQATPQLPAAGSASNADEEEKHVDSDSDFEYLYTHSQPRAVSTTAGTRKKTKQLGLRSMLEAGKKRYDLPRPAARDPPRRTAQRPVLRPRDPELVPARWPPGVIHLADNFNPEDIPVPGCPPFTQCYSSIHGDCRYETCENARVHSVCNESWCPFQGWCGNGTRYNDSVQLMRLQNTDIYTLQAAKPIPEGVIIGEYLGFLSLQPRDKRKRTANEGFRLHYHPDRDVWGSQLLCVDARRGGSLMRFLNHSCNPSAVFYEMIHASGRIIVATTIRDIKAGEELTVDYGDDLWFDCQCKDCSKRKRDESE